MPEITFNILKEVPKALISEEERNRLVQETNIAEQPVELVTIYEQSDNNQEATLVEETADLSIKLYQQYNLANEHLNAIHSQ